MLLLPHIEEAKHWALGNSIMMVDTGSQLLEHTNTSSQ
jgi:hypothetical protein